jgi:excisionase family DNA binding protein
MATNEPAMKETLQKKPARLVLILDVRLAAESQETILNALAPSAHSRDAQEEPTPQSTPEPPDPWLNFKDAAHILGLSSSTLYKYVSQRKIESRKLAGRLQFRKSELDHFLAQQVRPVHSTEPTRAIIHPALGSGK